MFASCASLLSTRLRFYFTLKKSHKHLLHVNQGLPTSSNGVLIQYHMQWPTWKDNGRFGFRLHRNWSLTVTPPLKKRLTLGFFNFGWSYPKRLTYGVASNENFVLEQAEKSSENVDQILKFKRLSITLLFNLSYINLIK